MDESLLWWHGDLKLFFYTNAVFCFHLQDRVYSSQDVKLRFMNAMHSIAKVTGKAVATAFDLSGFKTACDLGGKERAQRFMFLSNRPFFYLFLLFSSQDAPEPWRMSLPKPTLSCL